MNDEEAKVVQEVAKHIPRIVDSVDGFGRFLEASFGYPIKEATGFLGDWIKFRRDNFRGVCERAKATLDTRGVDTVDPIPAKYGVAIIEGAALEDDKLLQGMWAGLIANALDPKAPYNPSKLIISVLKELESHDALLLKHTAQAAANEGFYPNARSFTVERLRDEMGMDEKALHLALLNLDRLSLIKDPTVGSSERSTLVYHTTHHIEFAGHDEVSVFEPTALGMELIKACGVMEE